MNYLAEVAGIFCRIWKCILRDLWRQISPDVSMNLQISFHLERVLLTLTDSTWDFQPNFVGWESSFESNCPDILVVCETKFEGAIYPEYCLTLFRKDSVTYMHGQAVYVKDDFTWFLLENSEDSYLCFWLALFHSVFSVLFPSLFSVDIYPLLWVQFWCGFIKYINLLPEMCDFWKIVSSVLNKFFLSVIVLRSYLLRQVR